MKLARNQLVLIALVCAAPAVLGWLAYALHWTAGPTANYGELIEPRPLAGAPMDAFKGKWVLVTFDAPACDAPCERKLYVVRQVRRAQGQEMERMERLWVLTAPGAPKAALVAATDGERLAQASPAFRERFPGVVEEHIYLVDPLGNVMMRWPAEPDPAKMIKDLQRLLKYSRFG